MKVKPDLLIELKVYQNKCIAREIKSFGNCYVNSHRRQWKHTAVSPPQVHFLIGTYRSGASIYLAKDYEDI